MLVLITKHEIYNTFLDLHENYFINIQYIWKIRWKFICQAIWMFGRNGRGLHPPKKNIHEYVRQ